MRFIDAQKEALDLPDDYDICILGAGAAGITLALRFAGSSKKIILLESGDLTLDDQTQSLYIGENLGLPYYDLAACRLRYFGGTTNHWAGYCRPNDPQDYTGRPELGVPEWPVSESSLEPYIGEAERQLGLGADGFDPALLVQQHGFSDVDLLDDAVLQTKVYQISKQLRFRERYRDDLKAAANLTVVLNINVTKLGVESDGATVREAAFKVLGGQTGTIRARYFILACHAIENARILLNSNDVVAAGLGNREDMVGRYFMEHPAIKSGLFMANKPRFNRLYDASYMFPRHINANLSLTADAMNRSGILQYFCRFHRLGNEVQVRKAMTRLSKDFWEPFSLDVLDDIATVLSDLDEAGALVKEKLGAERQHPMGYWLDHRIEQSPNPDSRVVLSDERDQIGVRKADLDWRLNEVDYRTFRVGQDLIVKHLSAAGAGRFIVENLTDDYINERVTGRNHHMGTTRMAVDEKNGVVDSDCKVFGVHNLYVSGSSVFTTAGYGGPTMLIIALALRLADHMKKRLAA